MATKNPTALKVLSSVLNLSYDLAKLGGDLMNDWHRLNKHPEFEASDEEMEKIGQVLKKGISEVTDNRKLSYREQLVIIFDILEKTGSIKDRK